MRIRKPGLVVALLLALAVAAPSATPAATAGDRGAVRYGDLEFPRDEHQHLTGWDYWWGSADVVTTAGNHYTVGFAFNSHYGVGVTGHQLFAHQGPYDGKSILTEDGPAEWGHPAEFPDRFVRRISTYVPGVSELLRFETLDTADGMRDVGRWERTSLDTETYRLLIDHAQAKVHPSGERIRMLVDLTADMQGPPLLAGGSGTWWYGIPETYGYPSRSFQYMQSARTLGGVIELEQPDGTIVREEVDPARSGLLVTHEYDATPEDLFAGLALAEATQLHPYYPSYYGGGMPWELLFLDLRNGAQLMVAALAFHDTPDGTVAPIVGPDQPTYRVLATLRLPSGESVSLDDVLQVEHLSYRHLVGGVPTFLVQTDGLWTQAWDFRISYPGDETVPAFDLGVTPALDQSEPAGDAAGNRQVQRVPFDVRGSYGGCPVDGFGWSELIVNWYGREAQDPWFTGAELPPVPPRCTGRPPADRPPAGDLTPEPRPLVAPSTTDEGCTAQDPDTPTCEYVATADGGIFGYAPEPGGWTVTITRPGRAEPIVVPSGGGPQLYPCGTIRPGDHVRTEATPGAGGSVTAAHAPVCR